MTSVRKTVLITGCSAGGIGPALAKEFHTQGLQVFATSRRLESMKELADMGIDTIALDVTDIKAIREVRDQVAAITGGKLDILVNNAGQAYPVAITDMDMSFVRSIFEVNYFAPICMVQEFVRLLIASGDACIIQTGSISGIMPVPFSAAYNGSKAALHSLSNTLRVELAPFGVKVLNVVTGGIISNISRPHTIPDASLYKPMEDFYQSKRMNASQVNAMPADQYARIVVSEALKPNPRAWLWAGQNAWLVWFMDTFLGRRAFDWLMNKKFGMNEFAQRVAAAGAKIKQP